MTGADFMDDPLIDGLGNGGPGLDGIDSDEELQAAADARLREMRGEPEPPPAPSPAAADEGPSGEFHLLGPPGCGKTHALTRSWIPKAIERFGADAVAVCSLTRAAALEIAGRQVVPLPRERVATLHSFAKAALTGLWGTPELAQTPLALRRWNEGPAAGDPLLALSGASKPSELGDDGSVTLSDEGRERGSQGRRRRGRGPVGADEAFSQIEILRHRLVPEDRWPSEVLPFWRAWRAWKAEHQLYDFTDLIERAIAEEAPLARVNGVAVQALFADEAQDFSALEMRLARMWGDQVRVIVLAGDPNQCQPAGTMVLMEGGEEKPIEDVRVGDRVVTYFTGKSEFRGLRSSGRRVEAVASRRFDGDMLTLTAGEGETRCTPNHRVLLRSVKRRYWCLYLMQRGSSFRIGIARSRYDCGFGVAVRSRAEKADRAWILDCFDAEKDARRAEMWAQAHFGITGLMFQDPKGSNKLWPQDDLDEHHASLNSAGPAMKCLEHYGRHHAYPIWERGQRSHAVSVKSFVTQACNVVSGFFEMRSRSAWHPVVVTRVPKSCEVYSLKVQPTEGGKRLYVADGLVVHNSIYGFKGSDSRAFHPEDFPEERTFVLGQSYRLSPPVQAEAERFLRQASDRTPVSYAPREGAPASSEVIHTRLTMAKRTADRVIDLALDELRVLGDPDTLPSPDHGRVGILASAAYLVAPVVARMKERGVLFSNPYAPTRGDWNPLRSARRHITSLFVGPRPDLRMGPGVEATPEDRRLWTWKELDSWLEVCSAKGFLRRGARTNLVAKTAKAKPRETVEAADMGRVFEDWPHMSGEVLPMLQDPAREAEAVAWLADKLTPAHAKRLVYAFEVATGGVRQLTREPRVIVGTLHSIKGATVGSVILSPDLSAKHAAEFKLHGSGHDQLIHLFYVGMTRSASRLHLLSRQMRGGKRLPGVDWV